MHFTPQIMPTEPDRKPSPRRVVWMDLTDLVEFFRENSAVNGIQRVVSMIVMALDSAPNSPLDNAIEMRFCAYEFTTARYHELNFDRLKAALSHILVDGTNGPSITDTIGPAAAFQPNDLFLILGAFWFRASYCQIIIQTCVLSGLRLAVMCHDLIPVRYMRWYSAGYVNEIARIWDTMFAHAQLILTNSAYSARDVEDYCRSRALPVHAPQVLRFGDEILRPEIQLVSQNKRLSCYLDPGYVLTVGTLESRKNQILLLRVWARLLQTYGERTPYLILIGRHREPSNIDAITLRWKRKDRIVHLDNVCDSELAAFYRGCAFTVFPSLAEGWGLPVAESLAAGKLCLASNATAIPEVGGPLLEYFDPTDAEECYRKVELYFFDTELRARAEARIRSDYRKMPWEKCVQQLQQIMVEFSAADSANRAPV